MSFYYFFYLLQLGTLPAVVGVWFTHGHIYHSELTCLAAWRQTCNPTGITKEIPMLHQRGKNWEGINQWSQQLSENGAAPTISTLSPCPSWALSSENEVPHQLNAASSSPVLCPCLSSFTLTTHLRCFVWRLSIPRPIYPGQNALRRNADNFRNLIKIKTTLIVEQKL